MIRTNLSTRPFYNERAVRLVLLGAGLVVLAATLFNVTRILQLSRQDTQLATQAANDEARARDLIASAAQRRATVDPRSLEQASVEARQANDLIDRRTFSWTELFNRLEAALPANVRLSAVRPVVDEQGRLTVKLTVLGRDVESVDHYLDALEKTGAFHDLLSRKEREDNKEGLIEANVEGRYAPQAAVVPAGAAR